MLNLTQSHFNCRDLLPLQQDMLWKIEQGAVRTVTWNRDGNITTVGFWGANDVVGRPLSRLQPYQIECLTSVEVSAIASSQWHQLLDTIFQHAQQSEELINITQARPLHCRLLHLLEWLANKFGYPVEQGQFINLQLTAQELSETIITTKVTVNRLLNQFEKAGVITRRGGYLILLRRSGFTC